MDNKKTVAEMLREYSGESMYCIPDAYAIALTGTPVPCENTNCDECRSLWANKLADAIEAEQAEMRKRYDSSFDSFNDRIDRLHERIECVKEHQHHEVDGDVDVLPEGIEWPRFEDGEPVSIFDEVRHFGSVYKISFTELGYDLHSGDWGLHASYGTPVKRPEPEVLDADGVPIKPGDVVWDSKGESHEVVSIENGYEDDRLVWCGEYLNGMKLFYFTNEVTHRKPDTLEDVVSEMIADFDANAEHGMELNGYIDRLRKLMGGE